jgi:hypothetical protein
MLLLSCRGGPFLHQLHHDYYCCCLCKRGRCVVDVGWNFLEPRGAGRMEVVPFRNYYHDLFCCDQENMDTGQSGLA